MTTSRLSALLPALLCGALLVATASCDDSKETTGGAGPSAGSSAGTGSNETGRAEPSNGDDENASDSDDAETSASADDEDDGAPLKGRVRPGDVTESSEQWREAVDDADVDEEAASRLAEVEPGATIEVYFGPWCPDSRRELSDFWAALERIDDVPFDTEYVALDQNFDAGDVSLDGLEVEYVPTFVVRRDGEEVGRVVESAPNGIAKDLARLLSGEVEGTVSRRDDL